MTKVFTTLNTKIEEIENEDSFLSDSDCDDKKKSHLQFGETEWFQGVRQTTVVLPNERSVFNQTLEKGSRRIFSNRNIPKVLI